jgi:hypothetical protein
MEQERLDIGSWLDNAESRLRAVRVRQAAGANDAELLALIQGIGSGTVTAAPAPAQAPPLAPASPAEPLPLPPELQATSEELAMLQIKVHLLRARLEMSQEETEKPVPLNRMLALLTELIGHQLEMEHALEPAWSAWQALLRGTTRLNLASDPQVLRKHLREFLLGAETWQVKAALGRQRKSAQLSLITMAALKSASTAFSREVTAQFDPAAIMGAAIAAKSQAKAEDFWRQFEELADRLTPTEIEQRFMRHMVTAIEQISQENPTA